MWPWKKEKDKYEDLKLVVATSSSRREVKFSMSKGVPIIVCTINGKGARLLIDSGASLNVLEKGYARRYGFTVWKQRSESNINGIGGSSSIMGASKIELEIDAICTPMPFKAISFSGVHKKLGIAGVIGSKFLKDHNAILDYENRVLSWED